jgi:hypothetical protein
MTTAEANFYSINVLKILGNFSKVGGIHSVFKNSLNLSFGDRLINLNSVESAKPPFGVQMDESIINYIVDNIGKNDNVLWDADYKNIIFPSMNLKIKFNENYYHSQISPIEIDYSNFLINFSKLIKFAVGNQLQNGFDKDMLKIIEFYFNENKTDKDEFSKELRLLENSLLEEKLDSEVLNYWVGRGRGLTPSGDDFLVGVLALLSTLGYASSYSKDLEDYLLKEGYKRTTRIGFEYLWYASQGKFSDNIITLCKSMVEEDKKEFEKALWSLSDTGHTSGTDTILGIILSSKFIIGKHRDTLNLIMR